MSHGMAGSLVSRALYEFLVKFNNLRIGAVNEVALLRKYLLEATSLGAYCTIVPLVNTVSLIATYSYICSDLILLTTGSANSGGPLFF
jgi:hypothetical protein